MCYRQTQKEAVQGIYETNFIETYVLEEDPKRGCIKHIRIVNTLYIYWYMC